MFARIRRSRTHATRLRALGGLTLLTCCGCFDAMIAWVPAGNNQRPAAAAPAAEQAALSGGQNATPAPAQPPPGAAPGGQTPLVSPPAATAVQLHLKTGVALPQTGPNGTLMGFSIDYYVLAGMQSAQARYGKFHWIIEDARGQQVVCPFGPLREKGNLVVLKDGWRPEYGPFQCHVVVEHQGQRQVVSNVARLQ